MKEQFLLEFATAKRGLKRAAPLIFSLLKSLNQCRKQLWISPFVYDLRGRCFALKERCMGFPVLRRQFLEKNGYEIDLKSPRSFNQKISWLKLQPVTPLQVQAVDKARAKQLALTWAEEHGLALRASRTLAVVSRPSDIPWDSLPPQVVLKATHGSGSVKFVDRNRADLSGSLEPLLESWLHYPYGIYKHEWVYWPVRRRLLVEEWLDANCESGLVDYKFHMSHGECLMIQVNEGFRSGDRKRTMLLPPWNPQPVKWLYSRPDQDPVCPENLDQMMAIASAFSRDFPYIRVDLYSVKQTVLQVMFGEFTFFPGSGSEPVDPYSFDLVMGQRLKL